VTVHYVVDSSVWIEVFAQKPLAKICLKEIKSASHIYVPTVVLFEVYKKIVLAHSEHQGLTAVATLSQYNVRDLTREVALSAADIAIREKLAMADSLMLAHARSLNAILLSLDNDFSGLADTKVLRRV
jgi:toxin FitB